MKNLETGTNNYSSEQFPFWKMAKGGKAAWIN